MGANKCSQNCTLWQQGARPTERGRSKYTSGCLTSVQTVGLSLCRPLLMSSRSRGEFLFTSDSDRPSSLQTTSRLSRPFSCKHTHKKTEGRTQIWRIWCFCCFFHWFSWLCVRHCAEEDCMLDKVIKCRMRKSLTVTNTRRTGFHQWNELQ